MSDSDLHSPATTSTQVIDGRYRLLRLIGIGGMGAVYEAAHVAIGRRVAVKILHAQFSKHAELVERLRREAQAASRIGHPNIVDVTDFGRTEDGSAYMAMEFLDGTDLGAILRERGHLPETRALHIGLQTAQALAAAHRVGVVHRDLKPENIFIVNPLDWPAREPALRGIDKPAERIIPRSGGPSSAPGIYDLVKVLDFGIAVQLGSVPLFEPAVAAIPALRAGRLTNPGLTVGTPEYMAPEQAMGSSVDARADIYAVGTLLYEMVCGRVPFMAPSVPELLTMKSAEPAPPPRVFAPTISTTLESLILRCLERDPAARPQTMEEVEEVLLEMVTFGGLHIEGPRHLPSPQSSRSQRPLGPSQSQENLAKVSGDLLGRVAVPTPSSMTPLAASSSEHTTSGTRPVPPPMRRGKELRAGLALVAAAGLILIGFASARYFIRRGTAPRTEPRFEPHFSAPTAKFEPKLTAEPTAAPPQPLSSAPVLTPPPKTSEALESVSIKPAAKEEHPGVHEEAKMLLEWARRAALGKRYAAPPGDNLKELLARIEALSPNDSAARALRDETTQTLTRRLSEELRRRHPLDALESFRALRALDSASRIGKLRRELLYQLLFVARTGRRGSGRAYEPALFAAHGAVEVAPSYAAAHLALADVLLLAGKRESAAASYRRVIELRPREAERRLAAEGLRRLGKPPGPPGVGVGVAPGAKRRPH